MARIYQASRNIVFYRTGGNDVAFERTNLNAVRVDNEAREILKSLAQPTDEIVCRDDNQAFQKLVQLGFITAVPATDCDIFNCPTPQGLHPFLPTSFRFVVTEACNYRCNYCFEGQLPHRAQSMHQDVLRDVILKIARQINRPRPITVHWFGGEPLLRFPLIVYGVNLLCELVATSGFTSVAHALTTHGGLVTREIAEFLQRHSFQVLVSLDGPMSVNDRNRVDKNGKGTFERGLRGYELLVKEGVSPGIIVTPNAENLSSLCAGTIRLITQLKPSNVHINAPQPTANGWNINGAVLATQLFELSRYCSAHRVQLVSPGQKISRALTLNEVQRSDCVAPDGSCALSIGPDGRLGYCTVSWNDPSHSQDSSNWTLDSAANWKRADHRSAKCNVCPAENVCGGPCPLEASFGTLNPQRCAFYLTYLQLLLTT